MKKILLLILILFLFLSCYLIYNANTNKNLVITSIGDKIADNPYFKKNNIIYNNQCINNNYRITDLSHILKYNEEINIDDKSISLHNILKNTNILVISLGSNDLKTIVDNNTVSAYKYINSLIDEYDNILSIINKYQYDKVYILGYTTKEFNTKDLYTYTNYKLERLTKKYNYNYINLDKIVNKSNNFNMEDYGYYEIFKIIVEK